MLSELNGQENYFTRICVSGLLNTRKLELAHMLLQDISMFHQHPIRMPDANLDKDRLISSAVANMELNDRRSKMTKQPLLLSNTSMSSISKVASALTGHETTATAAMLSTAALLNAAAVAAVAAASSPATGVVKQTSRPVVGVDEDIELSLNDLTSFCLYASKKPSLVYQPIREHLPMSSTPQVNQINHGKETRVLILNLCIFNNLYRILFVI